MDCSTPAVHAEVEIMCGYRSISVHFIRMTDIKYTWSCTNQSKGRYSQP